MNSKYFIAGCCALALAGAPLRTEAADVAAAAPTASITTSPVFVRVQLANKEVRDLDLVGREGPVLHCRPTGMVGYAWVALPIRDIARTFFKVDYDTEAYNKAVKARQWVSAAQIIGTPVLDVLPYLDLPANNAVEPAEEACKALLNSGGVLLDDPGTNRLRRVRFQTASGIYRAIATATWSPFARPAAPKAVLCLAMAGDLEKARSELDLLRVPEPDDPEYGWYWFTEAWLRYRAGAFRDALNATVRSIVFQNKDVLTFPDALLISGRCYEEVLEFHRARDVYYEVARLFPGTPWDQSARRRLAFILEKGLTKDKENTAIETVFFGLQADINAQAAALLKGEILDGAEGDIPPPDKGAATGTVKKASQPSGAASGQQATQKGGKDK